MIAFGWSFGTLVLKDDPCVDDTSGMSAFSVLIKMSGATQLGGKWYVVYILHVSVGRLGTHFTLRIPRYGSIAVSYSPCCP